MAGDHTAKVQGNASCVGQAVCRTITKRQQRRFILFAVSSASSPPEIVLWTMCKFGLFLVVMQQSGQLQEFAFLFGAWITKQVEFHHGVLPQCLAALCHELCVPPSYTRIDESDQIQTETPMVQQGSQLFEWTEGLRIPSMLWQWPQDYNYLSGQKVS